jgi:hypothetical protein
LLVIRELLDFKPEDKGTNVDLALEYLTRVIKKRCTAFVVSDFIDSHDYYKAMSIANSKHDLIAVSGLRQARVAVTRCWFDSHL